MNASGKTQVYGVIGDPIEHTLSPAMHNAAFKTLNLDSVYLAFKVRSNQVENALRGMRGLGLRGLNVTMPHKKAVIPFLDKVDATAALLESVNTIVNLESKLWGFSTDGEGALRALQENGVKLANSKMVLLGAGGAANAIAFASAASVSELIVLNRTPEKTQKLTQVLNNKTRGRVTDAQLTEDTLQRSLQDANVLVNATSVGMNPNTNESLVEPSLLRSDLTVMDIVYNPLETKLARDAKAAGARVISGLDMLVYQGAASFEKWTGLKAPVKAMKKALLNQLGGKRGK